MIMQKIVSLEAAKAAFAAKFAKLIGEEACNELEFTKHFIRVNGDAFLAYIASDKEKNQMFVVPFHDNRPPSIEKYDGVKVFQQVNSVTDAVKAFTQEYGSLARVVNPAAKAYDGYKFKKETIHIRKGSSFEAFIAHDDQKTYFFVVPVDGDTPKIETFQDVFIEE